MEIVFIYSLKPRDAYIKLTLTLLQKSCSNMLCNNVLVSALNTMADNKAPAKKNTKATVNKMVCTQLVLIYCFDSHCNKILNRNVIIQIYLYSIAWLEEGKKIALFSLLATSPSDFKLTPK